MYSFLAALLFPKNSKDLRPHGALPRMHGRWGLGTGKKCAHRSARKTVGRGNRHGPDRVRHKESEPHLHFEKGLPRDLVIYVRFLDVCCQQNFQRQVQKYHQTTILLKFSWSVQTFKPRFQNPQSKLWFPNRLL